MKGKKLVREGYNAIAASYFRERARNAPDIEFVKDLARRLPPDARVLDAGCGAGVPLAEVLTHSCHIVGLDLATAQIGLARHFVPLGDFLCGDITAPPFRDRTFAAIVCVYAMIHVPRDEHIRLLSEFRRLLEPDGILLICMGVDDLLEDVADYHGARMYWSHYDAETNLKLLRGARFEILWSKIVEDATSPGSSHLFVMARPT